MKHLLLALLLCGGTIYIPNSANPIQPGDRVQVTPTEGGYIVTTPKGFAGSIIEQPVDPKPSFQIHSYPAPDYDDDDYHPYNPQPIDMAP